MTASLLRLSKRPLPALAAVFVAALGLLVASARAEKQLYTCGMHPQVISDEPGECPICGMDLQPVRRNQVASAKPAAERRIKYYKSTMIPGDISEKPGKDSMGMERVPVYEDAAPAAPAPDAIQVGPGITQEMNLQTDLVTSGPVVRHTRTVGIVAYDERGLSDVTTRFSGWIQKLFVNATWTSVKEGEPLFEIYSPELYNAELNYLLALKTEGAAGGPMSAAAATRLRLLGVPDAVLGRLARSGKAEPTFVFAAPAAGTVIEKDVVAGQMIQPGQMLLRLADLSRVWVNAELYEGDLEGLAAGQPAEVRLTYGGGRVLHGSIEQLLPQVDGASRTVVARIALDNPDGFLRPGMFADVRLNTPVSASAVLVPDSAVLRSGETDTVFIALPGGAFEPRRIHLGVRADDSHYVVLEGLKAGDRVVVSGQFLLDSESQLRDAIRKMLSPAPAPATAR